MAQSNYGASFEESTIPEAQRKTHLGRVAESFTPQAGQNYGKPSTPKVPRKKVGLARLGSYETRRLGRLAGMSKDKGKAAILEGKLRASGNWNQQTQKLHKTATTRTEGQGQSRWQRARYRAESGKRRFASAMLKDTMGSDPGELDRTRVPRRGIAPAYAPAAPDTVAHPAARTRRPVAATPAAKPVAAKPAPAVGTTGTDTAALMGGGATVGMNRDPRRSQIV